jgi:hypothetical protein
LKGKFQRTYYSPNENSFTDTPLKIYDEQCPNEEITIIEVENAIKSLNKNKAVGHYKVPAETIQNLPCIDCLHKLFCACFASEKKGKTHGPLILSLPCLKNPSADKSNPIIHRGITVISAEYKAYCSVN